MYDEYDKISNAYMLEMHGFCLENNQYDAVSFELQVDDFEHQQSFGRWKLEASLKQGTLDLDVIRFIKAKPSITTDASAIKGYLKIIKKRLAEYPTSLDEDQ